MLRDPLDNDDLQLAAGGLGKLIGDLPSASAILDRFLHHAKVISITGKSYRMRDRQAKQTGEA